MRQNNIIFKIIREIFWRTKGIPFYLFFVVLCTFVEQPLVHFHQQFQCIVDEAVYCSKENKQQIQTYKYIYICSHILEYLCHKLPNVEYF